MVGQGGGRQGHALLDLTYREALGARANERAQHHEPRLRADRGEPLRRFFHRERERSRWLEMSVFTHETSFVVISQQVNS